MKNYKSAIFIIIAAMLWGIDGIVLTPHLYGLPVILVVFIQSFLITFFLSPIAIKNKKQILNYSLKQNLIFILISILGGIVGTLCIIKAIFYVNYVNLSIVVLIQKLQPIFAITFAKIILKENLPKNFIIWSISAIIGTYFMTFGLKIPVVNNEFHLMEAVLYSLVAAVSFGFSTVASKKALNFSNYENATFLRFFYTFLISLILVLVFSEFDSISNITQSQWIIFVLITISTGGTAIFLYYKGLQNIKASISSICELAFPLTAIILEYFIRNNILNFIQWVGVIILIFSIYKVINTEK